MKNTLDILQVHENGAVFLLNESGDAGVVDHGAHPEAWDSGGTILDLLHIAAVHLELLVVFVVEFLRAGLVNLENVLGGDLLTGENLLTLLEDSLVEFVVLELKGTVESLLLFIDLSLLILLT